MNEPAGTEGERGEVTGNAFHGPTAFQQGGGNIQLNYFGPDLDALRTGWLRAYLSAARRPAHDRRYPGMLPGATPPLAAVYVRQQATRVGAGNRPDASEAFVPSKFLPETMSAEELAAVEHSFVLVAGPGGGKSTLLRACVARGVEQWPDGREGGTLPVLVTAEALANAPLADALAAFVSRDLDGLVEALPAAFFNAPPARGARWLVLVDGLDEIIAPAARREILGRLIAVGDAYADLYRFVIATRPLPAEEFGSLDSRLPRYDLEPFTPEDLPRVARSWFAGLPDPDGVTQGFLRALGRTRLAELARIPLMASLLCQLHAAAPDEPLPVSRGRIYRDFIALLYKRQYTPSSAGTPRRLGAGLENYPGAVHDAEEFLKALPDLISGLAAERYRGNMQDTLDIVESRSPARRPERVPREEWRAFIGAGLRHSGLLTVRAGEYVFLHQTLLEYLAAEHAVNASHADVLPRLFRHRYRYWVEIPVLGERAPLRRYWEPPREDPSYVGFLLDAAREHDPDAATPFLIRLATRGRMWGCHFIAAQARLGTYLPPAVVRATAGILDEGAQDTRLTVQERLGAALSLTWLGDARGTQLLDGLARDITLDHFSRSVAAWNLTVLGDPDSTELLHGLARDGSLQAAEYLARHDPRGTEILNGLACDTSLEIATRIAAAEYLARHDPRGAELLDGFARDTTHGARLYAAGGLTRVGDARGAEIMYGLARDTSRRDFARTLAADALATLEDLRTTEMLNDLARDTTLGGLSRVKAAAALAKLGDPRGTDLLDGLARDITLVRFHRVEAAKALAELVDPRSAELLDGFARDTTHDTTLDTTLDRYARKGAAEALTRLLDSHGDEIGHTLASSRNRRGKRLRLRRRDPR